MNSLRQKEIDALRAQLAALEEAQAQELKQKQALENAYARLMEALEVGEVTLEALVRLHYRDFRRIMAKIERDKVAPPPVKVARKKAAVKKKIAAKGRRRQGTAKTVPLSIPAGRYSGIPTEPDKVFIVKEKGPRPKALKAYAEEIGLESFIAQCRIS